MDQFAYDASVTCGVRLAMGDFDGDGLGDTITAPGPGCGPHIKVFSGATHLVIREFFAYDATMANGVWVASGDVDGDGKDEIITGVGKGGGAEIRIFAGYTGTLIRSFNAFDPNWTNGAVIAVGKLAPGQGLSIVVVPEVNSQLTKVFSAATGMLQSNIWAPFNANPTCPFPTQDGGCMANSYPAAPAPLIPADNTSGLRVALADVDGDGLDDLMLGVASKGLSSVPSVKCESQVFTLRGFDHALLSAADGCWGLLTSFTPCPNSGYGTCLSSPLYLLPGAGPALEIYFPNTTPPYLIPRDPFYMGASPAAFKVRTSDPYSYVFGTRACRDGICPTAAGGVFRIKSELPSLNNVPYEGSPYIRYDNLLEAYTGSSYRILFTLGSAQTTFFPYNPTFQGFSGYFDELNVAGYVKRQ